MEMGSPLGPVVADIFIVELETGIFSTLENIVLNWKRFVYDAIGYVENGSIDITLSKLSSLHPNIQLFYEAEEEN